jgi:hypothetical protein
MAKIAAKKIKEQKVRELKVQRKALQQERSRADKLRNKFERVSNKLFTRITHLTQRIDRYEDAEMSFGTKSHII